MTERTSRFPLMRVMTSNALLLSALYAVVGTGVELWRRYAQSDGSKRASLVVDSLPARVLELLGLMRPLREAYFAQRLTEFQVRLAFGVTAVAIIFVLAFAVGIATSLVRSFVERRQAARHTR